MVDEKQLYVSFDKPEYLTSKQEFLNIEGKFSEVQKSMKNIKALRSRKKRLITQLKKLIIGTLFTVEKLDEKMPDSNLPKLIKKKIFTNTQVQENTETLDMEVQSSRLDNELKDIQKKLEQLNSIKE